MAGPIAPENDFDRLLEEPFGSDSNNPVNLVSSAANVPTVYADGCLYATRTQSVVRLSFIEAIFEPLDSPNPGQKTRHVGNLIMPMEGLKGTLTYLNGLMKAWEQEGASDGE